MASSKDPQNLRRLIMRYLFFLLFATVAFADQPKPEEALKLLIEGNQRFAEGNKKGAGRGSKRRLAKKTFQNPYAVIVACSDSRVAPEMLFDAGLGDLFIVRVAGNVITEVGMESVNYAAFLLETPLILVMGHQNCGAVKAVLAAKDQTIPQIAGLIEPAAVKAQNEKASNLLERATELNAINMKEILLQNPEISKKVKGKQLLVEAAYYDFTTGKVKVLQHL